MKTIFAFLLLITFISGFLGCAAQHSTEQYDYAIKKLVVYTDADLLEKLDKKTLSPLMGVPIILKGKVSHIGYGEITIGSLLDDGAMVKIESNRTKSELENSYKEGKEHAFFVLLYDTNFSNIIYCAFVKPMPVSD